MILEQLKKFTRGKVHPGGSIHWRDDSQPAAVLKSGWLKSRLAFSPAERKAIVTAQEKFDGLRAQKTPVSASVFAKEKWTELQRAYAQSHDEKLLDELGVIGHHGQDLAEKLVAQNSLVSEVQRRVTSETCAKELSTVFGKARDLVLSEVAAREETERGDALKFGVPFEPSTLLRGLARQAESFANESVHFAQLAQKPGWSPPPRQVLGELFPNDK
jgi:hypothetical protein